jgi:hypothetical protein
MGLLACILILLLFASPVLAIDYYISAAGSGSACSSGTPCALATAVATATSGDTIFFKSDDSWTGVPPLLTVVAGVTYDGSTYGTGTRAELKATGAGVDGNTGIINVGKSTVTIKGFKINGNSQDNANGINIGAYTSTTNFSDIIVDNCEVLNITSRRGIYVGPTYGAAQTISNVIIINTSVHDIPGNGTSWGSGIVIYPTWQYENNLLTDVLIRNCTIYNVFIEGIYIKDQVTNITVEFNNVYGNGNGIHFEGSEYEGSGPIVNAVVRYNLIYDNLYSGLNFVPRGYNIDASFYGNLVWDNCKTGYGLHSCNVKMAGNFATSTINFYNNTFAINSSRVSTDDYIVNVSIGDGQNDGGGITGTPTINLVNNIIFSDSVHVSGTPFVDYNNKTTVHSNNLFYRLSGSLVRIGATTYSSVDIDSWEATNKHTDPTFTGGTLPTGFTGIYGVNMVPNTTYFAITSGDALNNGVTLGSPYNGCINGAGLSIPLVRPVGTYDIGAYELDPIAAFRFRGVFTGVMN